MSLESGVFIYFALAASQLNFNVATDVIERLFQDERLDGGYEAVPTRDIHTNQVGFERHWLHILQLYVRPLQELVFTGYIHDVRRPF
jgi:hypothetical protein